MAYRCGRKLNEVSVVCSCRHSWERAEEIESQLSGGGVALSIYRAYENMSGR